MTRIQSSLKVCATWMLLALMFPYDVLFSLVDAVNHKTILSRVCEATGLVVSGVLLMKPFWCEGPITTGELRERVGCAFVLEGLHPLRQPKWPRHPPLALINTRCLIVFTAGFQMCMLISLKCKDRIRIYNRNRALNGVRKYLSVDVNCV